MRRSEDDIYIVLSNNKLFSFLGLETNAKCDTFSNPFPLYTSHSSTNLRLNDFQKSCFGLLFFHECVTDTRLNFVTLCGLERDASMDS